MAGERHGHGMLCVNPPLTSSESKKKETRYACLSEAKTSHSRKTCIEVSFSAPHHLHLMGLQVSPIKCGCLHRVLCPVERIGGREEKKNVNSRESVLLF